MSKYASVCDCDFDPLVWAYDARAEMRVRPVDLDGQWWADQAKEEGDYKPWECAARKSVLPEPADCDWPICGCDPYADKVIAALEEAGVMKDAG